MNPFQYEVVKHPLKTVGNGLVAVDDFVSKALVRKRSRRILDGRKEVITPISPIGKLYRKQPDCKYKYDNMDNIIFCRTNWPEKNVQKVVQKRCQKDPKQVKTRFFYIIQCNNLFPSCLVLLELQLNDGRKPKKVRIYKLFPFRSLIFDFF